MTSPLFSTAKAPGTGKEVGVIYINTDGGSRGNPGPAAIGITAQHAGEVIFEKSSTIGEATNNTAEYAAVIQAMDWLKGWIAGPAKALPHNVKAVRFLLDSQLVVEQLSGRYKVKQPHILKYVRQVQIAISTLNLPITFSYVPRAQNARADALVNEALDAAAGI